MKTPQNIPYIMYKGVCIEKPYTQMNINMCIFLDSHIYTHTHTCIHLISQTDHGLLSAALFSPKRSLDINIKQIHLHILIKGHIVFCDTAAPSSILWFFSSLHHLLFGVQREYNNSLFLNVLKLSFQCMGLISSIAAPTTVAIDWLYYCILSLSLSLCLGTAYIAMRWRWPSLSSQGNSCLL